MSYIMTAFAGLVLVGVGLAIYEARRKRSCNGHNHAPLTQALRAERERAANPPGSHGGLNEPHMH